MDASRCKWDFGEVGCGCNNLSGLLLGRSRPWPWWGSASLRLI